MNPRQFTRLLMSAALAVGVGGCSVPAPRPEPDRFNPPTDAVVIGDWDDVESSVRVGASQSEMAILEVKRPDDRTAIFEFLTITDEPASLEVHRDLFPEDSGSFRLNLRASVGTFGDAAWQERLIDRVSRRLRQLAGVDVAPITEP
ncbi:MAG: hypothetical protein AMXMBFR58_37200 [Phycisphaerae bacterium]